MNDDKAVVREIREFSADGNCIKEIHYNKESGKVHEVVEFVYEQGALKKGLQTYYYDSGAVSSVDEDEYECGKIKRSKVTQYGESGNVTSITEYDDFDGLLENAPYRVPNRTKETYYDDSGNVSEMHILEVECREDVDIYNSTWYDGEGKVTSIEISDHDKKSMEAKRSKLRSFDDSGNVTEIKLYECEYELDGRTTKREIFTTCDGLGNVTCICEEKYERGILNSTKETAYNGSGDVTSICESEFDEDGNLRKKTEYNSSGVKLREKLYW